MMFTRLPKGWHKEQDQDALARVAPQRLVATILPESQRAGERVEFASGYRN